MGKVSRTWECFTWEGGVGWRLEGSKVCPWSLGLARLAEGESLSPGLEVEARAGQDPA